MSTSSRRPPLPSRPTAVDDDDSVDDGVKGKHVDDDDSDAENNNNARHRPPRPSMRGIRQSLAATASQRRRRRRSSARFLRLHNHQHAEDPNNGDEDENNSSSSSTESNLQELYQKAIRLHAENKINASNSWNLHLIENIDNFLIENDQENDDEVSDEEETQEGTATVPDNNKTPRNSSSRVNFTKASCTLDASVKIYSYRVDDVHLTSYKVLANLNRSDTQKQKQRKETENEASNNGEDDQEPVTRSRGRAAAGAGSTVENHVGRFSILLTAHALVSSLVSRKFLLPQQPTSTSTSWIPPLISIRSFLRCPRLLMKAEPKDSCL